MPKAKKKLAPEGSGPPGVQWAPISTVQRAAMMPEPLPAATASTSPFPSPASEGPPGPGAHLRAAEARGPVLPSNGPTGHHHHYIPTPSSSGRGTPTGIRPGPPPPPSFGGPVPRDSRSPFPDQPRPSGRVLSRAPSPQLSSGRRTPAADHRPLPPGVHSFRHTHSHPQQQQPSPQPSSLPQHPPYQRHPTSARQSPSQEHSRLPPRHATGPAESRPPRGLTDDEIRRTQRFMSLNWRVGVINHPPFARREHPAADGEQPQNVPPVAGFVGQTSGFPGPAGGGQGQRPR